jgi:hypothetical protein
MNKTYTIKLTWVSGFTNSYSIDTDSQVRVGYEAKRIESLSGIKEYSISEGLTTVYHKCLQKIIQTPNLTAVY